MQILESVNKKMATKLLDEVNRSFYEIAEPHLMENQQDLNLPKDATIINHHNLNNEQPAHVNIVNSFCSKITAAETII